MNDKPGFESGFMIDIGEYKLRRLNRGIFWITKPEGQYAGEGMQTTEEKLIVMLNEFWKREF